MAASKLENQRALVDRIASALTSVTLRVENNDSADLIDWCATIQLLTAELVTTAITDVRNK